jgi:photosystem II stability/assembly factor-like uncharacterized protein
MHSRNRQSVRAPSAWLALPLLLAAGPIAAQPPQAADTMPKRAVLNVSDDPVLRPFRWRSIGPVGQGGRVDDIAVVENDTRTFYVGFATGGLWKTTNRGTTFEPIFDTYGTHSVGDIAIAPSDPNIIWVGTGEPNNRQSSSFGDGIYKSQDGGKTFTHTGLRETQTIARVVVHPTNPDIVWVAANGRLFGANPERGVFMTTDGGRTWTRTLYVDENTGATELLIDPANPDRLFAATYQRRRTSWGFNGGGAGSGIWRSEDGGRKWTRLEGNGLPRGTMGRVALDIARSNPRILYAQIEVAPDREQPIVAQNGAQQGGGGGGGGGGGFGGNSNAPPDSQLSGVWRSDDGGQSWRFLNNHNVRPMYFSQIRVDPTNPEIVYTAGVQFYKSIDGGKNFAQVDGPGHVDHHAIWIDPSDGDHLMIGNDGSVDVSWDQATSWESLRTWAVGQPYHASVDMRRPYYVCTGLQDNGSWCGPSAMRNGPILAQDWYRVGGGDGFYSAVDPTDHNIIFSESQGGNVRRYNLRTGENVPIRPRGRNRPGQGGGGGGGGFGGQNLAPNIVPEPTEGEQFRFNWNTPLLLSPHNPRTLFVGGNRLFISRNRGDTYTMTPDLTRSVDRDTRQLMNVANDLPNCGRGQGYGRPCINSRNDGVSAYGTITTVAESPIVPGILWVGTDDGNVQVSRDGGATWTEVGKRIPDGTKEYYVSRVEASWVDAGTAYLSLDGHRSDDLKPYVYVTRDYGATWTPITSDLPAFGNVNTIRQDPRNQSVLYAGTEFGFFISLDEGKSWKRFMNDLPVVRIDDVLIHPRDNDLVLATHGRSIMIMDDVTSLQSLTQEVRDAAAHLFTPREAVQWKADPRASRSVTGHKNFLGENPEVGTAIQYWLKEAPRGDVTLTVTHVQSGAVFRKLNPTKDVGLNRVQWNLRADRPPRPEGAQQGGGGGGFGGGGQNQGPAAEPGLYRVTLTVDGRNYSADVRVLEDVWLGGTN